MRLPRLLFVLCLAAISSAQEPVDLGVIHRIRTEAFENSKIMNHLFYLTDVHGPRVTNSRGYRSAADWATGRMKEFGLTNVKKEPFPFGTSWECTHFEAHMTGPQYSPLIGFPLAWTAGTNGRISGEPMLAAIRTEADFERFKGKLKGQIVLTMPPRELLPQSAPMMRRLTDAELAERALTADPSRASVRPPFLAGPAAQAGPQNQEAAQAAARLRTRIGRFLREEGARLVLQYGAGTASDGGTVFATSGGSRDPKEGLGVPTIALTPEHYNRMARLLENKIPVLLEADIKVQVSDAAEDSFNITAEIEGTRKKDEVVMLGGHFDSWHGGTGATDNGTGTAVAIEAMRILKAIDVKMDRTVRIALWGGEEQGLLGSIAYVKQNFADRADMKLKPAFHKLSAYYNSDTGTGKFRGIGIGGNDMVRPIFEAWMAPLRDLGFTTITGTSARATRAPGGTDHTSFDYAGLPGFGFLQDPMEYSTRTHHSNMDTYDRVQRGDIMQSAAIMAVFAYHTATRAELLPRKSLPKPQPWRTPGSAAESPLTP